MESIRKKYGVPARRGMTITYTSQRDGEEIEALIVGSTCSNRLLVRLRQINGQWNKSTSIMHPTWNLTYPPKP